MDTSHTNVNTRDLRQNVQASVLHESKADSTLYCQAPKSCIKVHKYCKSSEGIQWLFLGEMLLKAPFIENKHEKRDIAPDISFGVSQKKENNTVETT